MNPSLLETEKLLLEELGLEASSEDSFDKDERDVFSPKRFLGEQNFSRNFDSVFTSLKSNFFASELFLKTEVVSHVPSLGKYFYSTDARNSIIGSNGATSTTHVELFANTTMTAEQRHSVITSLPGNHFLITWVSALQDGAEKASSHENFPAAAPLLAVKWRLTVRRRTIKACPMLQRCPTEIFYLFGQANVRAENTIFNVVLCTSILLSAPKPLLRALPERFPIPARVF